MTPPRSFANVFDLQGLPPHVAVAADVLRPALLASGWTVLAETPTDGGPPGASTFWLFVPRYGEVLVSPDPGDGPGRGWGLHVTNLPRGGWGNVFVRAYNRANLARHRANVHLAFPGPRPLDGEPRGSLEWVLRNRVEELSRAFETAVAYRDGVEEEYDRVAAQVANARGLAARVRELSERELRENVVAAWGLARSVWCLGGHFRDRDHSAAYAALHTGPPYSERPAAPGDMAWLVRNTRVTIDGRGFVASSYSRYAVLGVRGDVSLALPVRPGPSEFPYAPVEAPSGALFAEGGVPFDVFGAGTLGPMGPLPRGFSGWRPAERSGRWLLIDGAGRAAAGAFVSLERARVCAGRLNQSANLAWSCRA